MRIMFMGTPEFARVSLEALSEDGRDVVCAVTQPDKPKGRGYEKAMSDVKKYALEKGIDVLQPDTLKDGAFAEALDKYKPDIITVVAYGKILPEYVLNFPKYGCINIHGSLLPKYRGAAPIQRAVINGEKVSGVTSMYMEKGLDTGAVLLKREVEISPEMTSGTLHDILAKEGGRLLLETLDAIKAGNAVPQKQNDAFATYAPMLSKAEGEINWNENSAVIINKIRGFNPWPMAFSFISGKRFVVAEGFAVEEKGEPGKVIRADKEGLLIACRDKSILIKEIKVEGKKKMSVEEYLRGHRIETGEIIGQRL